MESILKPLYLLDTNVISEMTRPRPDPRVMEALRIHQGLLALAAPVWHELVYGVERLPEGPKKAQLHRFLMEVISPHIPVIPYDDHAAWLQGRVRASLEAQGQKLPWVDSQIAAIAVAHNLILVTRNTQDFKKFPGLMLETWASPPPAGGGVM